MPKYLKDFLKGIYAGAAIALGGILNIVAKCLLTNFNANLASVVGSLLFPIGLTLVCFLGFNLFTGKIGYLFDNKKDYLLFLLIIYLGNVVGSLIIGFLAFAIFNQVPEMYSVATTIATNKTIAASSLTSTLKLLAGSCLCGMLVYIAVFFYKTFKNNILKVIGIFIPIALFVYLGYDHCVANMFYFTFGFKVINGYSFLNILIATIGNSLGAIALNEVVKLIKKAIK